MSVIYLEVAEELKTWVELQAAKAGMGAATWVRLKLLEWRDQEQRSKPARKEGN